MAQRRVGVGSSFDFYPMRLAAGARPINARRAVIFQRHSNHAAPPCSSAALRRNSVMRCGAAIRAAACSQYSTDATASGHVITRDADAAVLQVFNLRAGVQPQTRSPFRYISHHHSPVSLLHPAARAGRCSRLGIAPSPRRAHSSQSSRDTASAAFMGLTGTRYSRALSQASGFMHGLPSQQITAASSFSVNRPALRSHHEASVLANGNIHRSLRRFQRERGCCWVDGVSVAWRPLGAVVWVFHVPSKKDACDAICALTGGVG